MSRTYRAEPSYSERPPVRIIADAWAAQNRAFIATGRADSLGRYMSEAEAKREQPKRKA